MWTCSSPARISPSSASSPTTSRVTRWKPRGRGWSVMSRCTHIGPAIVTRRSLAGHPVRSVRARRRRLFRRAGRRAATTSRSPTCSSRRASTRQSTFIAGLAGTGRALELGIGTGRIALPLAQRGVPVHGIELSRAMVARMRAKPGGADIPVTIGDFATTTAEGSFTVAYLVFNTIVNLTTQAAQVECFRNVAAHLEPGGCFVVEVDVPELRLLPPGETVPAVPRRRVEVGDRRVRRREPGPHLASPRDRRRAARALLGALPLRLAGRARPHGAARRDAAARALGRLGAESRSRATAACTSPSGRSRSSPPGATTDWRRRRCHG